MAKSLHLQIASSSKNGCLVVTGPFDLGYGFTSQPLQSGSSSHFAAEGVQLKTLDDGKAEYSVSIKELISDYVYMITFSNDSNIKNLISVEGEIEYHSKVS
jgi:hypothetical protein